MIDVDNDSPVLHIEVINDHTFPITAKPGELYLVFRLILADSSLHEELQREISDAGFDVKIPVERPIEPGHVYNSAQLLPPVIVELTGGLSGLAAVLWAFFARNKFKTIRFREGSEPLEIKGYSVKEVAALMDSLHSRSIEASNASQQSAPPQAAP